MYGNNCSDYDFLSHCGNRGVHLDSGENRTAYYVHYGESVPCGVSVPVHVRCGRVLLHSYQKLLRVFVPIASAIVLLSLPAYADEVEASEQNIEVVEHELENVALSAEEASDLDNDRLGEIISSPVLRSPSLNQDDDFNVLGYSFTKSDTNQEVYFDLLLTGSPSFVSFNRTLGESTSLARLNAPNYRIVIRAESMPYIVNYIVGPNDSHIPVNVTVSDYDSFQNISVSLESETTSITTYLHNVSLIFTWLLATIGTLIAFILANPFLAVSLLLFLAGTIISFYIRIKNA